MGCEWFTLSLPICFIHVRNVGFAMSSVSSRTSATAPQKTYNAL
jgi:hypothetical protein